MLSFSNEKLIKAVLVLKSITGDWVKQIDYVSEQAEKYHMKVAESNL